MTVASFSIPAASLTNNLGNANRLWGGCRQAMESVGLEPTLDTGQADWGNLASLPDSTNWPRIYRLNDGHEPEIFIRHDFYNQGAWNTVIAGSLQIGLGSDGAGNILNSVINYPAIGQDLSVSNPIPPLVNAPQSCYFSKSEGFYGCCLISNYGMQSASYAPIANDIHSCEAYFICRDTDDAGDVIEGEDGGFTIIVWCDGYVRANVAPRVPRAIHVSAQGVVTPSTRISMEIGGDVVTQIAGAVPCYNIYASTPMPRRLAQLLAVYRSPLSTSHDEFQVAAVGSQLRNFIKLPGTWPAGCFPATETRSCFAMLWE